MLEWCKPSFDTSNDGTLSLHETLSQASMTVHGAEMLSTVSVEVQASYVDDQVHTVR